MPMMIGFAQHRLALLQQELEKILEMLPQLGIKRCTLLNPLYPGIVERDTSLKLVMIMDVTKANQKGCVGLKLSHGKLLTLWVEHPLD